MPTYRPAGEDAPLAMLAQAEHERRERRISPGQGSKPTQWRDPVKPGWPGPMKNWTKEMHEVFEQAYHRAKVNGSTDPFAFACGWGAVTRMPEGRNAP